MSALGTVKVANTVANISVANQKYKVTMTYIET